MKKVMHVLQLKGLGGVQELVYNLVKGLKKYNVESYIFTFKGSDETNVIKFEQEGILVYVSQYPVKDIRNIKEILKLAKIWDVQFLHVHNTVPQMLCSIVLRLCPNKLQGFVTEHSKDSIRRKYTIFKLFDEFFYLPYTKIISVSKSVNSSITNWLKHIKRENFMVIENGIDINRFANAISVGRNLYGFNSDDIVIISIGRLVKSKGFITLIKALEFLPTHYKLLIIGDGPQKEELVRLVNMMEYEDRVVLAGQKNKVEGYLKMGDVYVSASISEGFGLTIVEASAAGLPVVCSDIPSYRDMIPPNQLFQINDHKELSEILRNQDYKHCKELASLYSIEKMVYKYACLYK